MELCDNLVNVGLAFMTLGMLFGALWAKEAWGHYWSWDPKETWRLLRGSVSFAIYISDEPEAKSAYGACRTSHLLRITADVLVWH